MEKPGPTFCHHRQFHLSTMDFFAFPVEIRLKIYSELLAHREIIKFPAKFRDALSARLCTEGINLCPALLRASKQVFSEAISLLYGKLLSILCPGCGVDRMQQANHCLRSADRSSSKPHPSRLRWVSYCSTGKQSQALLWAYMDRSKIG